MDTNIVSYAVSIIVFFLGLVVLAAVLVALIFVLIEWLKEKTRFK